MKGCILFIFLMVLSTSIKAQWIPINSGLSFGVNTSAIATDGTNLYGGVADSISGGMYISSDTGNSWTAINSGLPSLSVWCIATSGSKIFTSIVGYGIFLSTDYGNTWSAINSGLTSAYVSTIVIKDSFAYAGTVNAGIFKSLITTSSYNWTPVNVGLGSLDVKSIAISDNGNLYAGTQITTPLLRGLYFSTDGGNSWSQENSGISGSCVDYIGALIAKDSTVLASGGMTTYLDPPDVFRTNSNMGSPSWTSSSIGLGGSEVHSFHSICNIIFAGCGGGSVFYSSDNGLTWNFWGTPSFAYILSQTSIGSTLFVAGGGFYKRDASDLCQMEQQEQIALEMPNVFSPNCDGINDNFSAIKMSGISHSTLKIFNRWGQKLMETGDLTQGWDGKYNNTYCSDGAYFWTINYETVAGKLSTIKGNVLLLK